MTVAFYSMFSISVYVSLKHFLFLRYLHRTAMPGFSPKVNFMTYSDWIRVSSMFSLGQALGFLYQFYFDVFIQLIAIHPRNIVPIICPPYKFFGKVHITIRADICKCLLSYITILVICHRNDLFDVLH